MAESTCDRCGKVYNPYVGDRFWSGTFVEDSPDGGRSEYGTLCDNCHRDVVRS